MWRETSIGKTEIMVVEDHVILLQLWEVTCTIILNWHELNYSHFTVGSLLLLAIAINCILIFIILFKHSGNMRLEVLRVHDSNCLVNSFQKALT